MRLFASSLILLLIGYCGYQLLSNRVDARIQTLRDDRLQQIEELNTERSRLRRARLEEADNEYSPLESQSAEPESTRAERETVSRLIERLQLSAPVNVGGTPVSLSVYDADQGTLSSGTAEWIGLGDSDLEQIGSYIADFRSWLIDLALAHAKVERTNDELTIEVDSFSYAGEARIGFESLLFRIGSHLGTGSAANQIGKALRRELLKDLGSLGLDASNLTLTVARRAPPGSSTSSDSPSDARINYRLTIRRSDLNEDSTTIGIPTSDNEMFFRLIDPFVDLLPTDF